MKKYFNLLLSLTFTLSFFNCSNDDNNPSSPIASDGEIIPCINGLADNIYPCSGYDLLSRISLDTFDAASGNDSWGWTDPATTKEYAIVGLDNGTAFIDISTPSNPIYLGKLPTATVNSPWRDIKIYRNHAFIVSEALGHGMQVFDLTNLRTVNNVPASFTSDYHYTEFGSAHNIVINEDSGFAYVVGARTVDGSSFFFNGGPHFVNLQDPKNPIPSGGFISSGGDAYSHDAQVVTYNGPDPDYIGREILIGSNQIEVVIADITDKNNPITISTINYADTGYTHQGWFTEDQRFFLLGDELDEQRIGFDTRTVIFDFHDLDAPKFHMNYFGLTSAIDHNGYVNGDKFYLSNYRSGFRVMDISGIETRNISEIGFFDTYPANDDTGFDGVWNVYPFFESGIILISDINSGMFLVQEN